MGLDVSRVLGGDALGEGVEWVGSAREIGGGELDGPAVGAAEGCDLFGIGGDEEGVELGAGAGCFVDPGEHGAACDGAEDLAGKAGGGEAGGDDSEDADAGVGVLFAGGGIKYHGIWNVAGLLRDASPHLSRVMSGCGHEFPYPAV